MPTDLVAARLRASTLCILGLELAFALATLQVIRLTTPWATTYSGASVAAAAADLAAGLGLIVVGTVMTLGGRRANGVVASLAGVAWLSADWVGWQDGIPLVRSVAMVVTPFFLPLMLHLVLGHPKDGSTSGGRTRLALLIAYSSVAAITIGRVLVDDPLIDSTCWSNCTDDVFLVSSRPALAETLRALSVLTTLILGVAVLAAGTQRLLRTSAVGRRVTWPLVAPCLLVGASAVAYAIVLLWTPQEGPQSSVFASLFQARAWSAAAVAVGLGWTLVRARGVRASVARLASDLGATPRPGSVRSALARAMNDPTLEVVYWLPDAERYVDDMGRSVSPGESEGGRAVMPIIREGRTVALVVHDAAAGEPERLADEIGAAARLAVENERLQAELLAHLHDLRASRARIVATGDSERVRLERNLHDGAQQRLLALLYDLRLTREHVPAAGDPLLAELMESAIDEAQSVITELRDVAHGIYPAILAESGLRSALLSLAVSASVPVVLHHVTTDRFASAVERTAYVLIAAAVDRAGEIGAGSVDVRVERLGDRLVVEVDGAGRGPFGDLADRAGAVGGSVTNDGTTLRADIPCA